MIDLGNMINMVRYVLEKNDKARDDDVLLQKVIHYNEYRKGGMEYNIQERSWIEHLDDIVKGVISKPETIRRARRKCQELYPHTRGGKYNHRKERQREVHDYIKQIGKEEDQEKTQTNLWKPSS